MGGNLQAWASAKSSLVFTEEALQAGRDKALAVWNQFPTDGTESGRSVQLATSSILEDAAYAFAFLDESLRMDTQKMIVKGSGLEGDPARNLSGLTGLALQAVDDYTKWVAEAKPLMEAGRLGF